MRPLTQNHPYAAMMDFYGLWHSGSQKALDNSWKDQDWSDLPSTDCRKVYQDMRYRASGQQAAPLWYAMKYHTDAVAGDVEQLMQEFQQVSYTKEADDYWADVLKHVSPQSPWVVILQIQDHWDQAQGQATQWEKEQGDVPAIMAALAKKYAELKRWTEAERCWRRYITVSPDYDGYRALAGVYEDQRLPDKWLQTLKEFLEKGQAYGLEDAQAEDQIANYLDGRGKFQEALPYADAEAESGAAWALQTDAYARALAGNWAQAFARLHECEDHYDQSPYDRYSLCCVSGQGDLKQSAGDLEQFIAARKTRNLLTIDDMYGYVGLQLVNKNDANARQMLESLLKQYPDARAALHLAVISSRLGDAAGAEGALDQAVKLSPPDTPFARFAGVLRKAMHGGGTLNPRDVDYSLQLADENGELTISYLAARYMLTHSQQSQAATYLRRCFHRPRLPRIEIAPAAMDARGQGIDPWACIVNSLKAAATQPAN
jgi:tetratricopeptide (TPR) repeat protein